MAIGFNTGAKAYDNYFEAWWEILECAYKNRGTELDLTSANTSANKLEGTLSLESAQSYYSNYYHEDYFKENHKSTFRGIEDSLESCDVNKTLAKWGFSPVEDYAGVKTSTKDRSNYDILFPKRFKGKYVDKITNFKPLTDKLEIDTDAFDTSKFATFAGGVSKKEVKKVLAKQDFDFLYDQKKGGLYFNENGSDKGFGNGGLIAILKGAPNLTASHLDFI